MRPLLPYLMLALAVFQGGAALLLPLAQVGMARARASTRLRNGGEDGATFVLHRSDFARERSGTREWWHNGQLYDLRSMDLQGDSVRVTALPDACEQWLLTGFQRLFTRGGAHSPLTHLLVRLFAQPFLSVGCDWSLSPPTERFFRYPFFFHARSLPGSSRIFSPPPEKNPGLSRRSD